MKAGSREQYRTETYCSERRKWSSEIWCERAAKGKEPKKKEKIATRRLTLPQASISSPLENTAQGEHTYALTASHRAQTTLVADVSNRVIASSQGLVSEATETMRRAS